MAEDLSFEVAMQRLEQIVKELEAGGIQLEASLELFEEGVQLSRSCKDKLDEAQRRVEVLLEEEGVMKKVPYTADVEGSSE